MAQASKLEESPSSVSGGSFQRNMQMFFTWHAFPALLCFAFTKEYFYILVVHFQE